MKKIIAIPLEAGKLSPHFGHSESFAFVTTEDEKVISVITATPPEHVPGSFPRWVAANGATDVIVGGMGPQAVNLFNSFNINVFVGAPSLNPVELAEKFVQGKLSLQANYCNHDENHHLGAHHHHHHHGHSHD